METKWVNKGERFQYKILRHETLNDQEKDFMKTLFLNYIEKNINYHHKTADWYFYYGEIQNTSAMYPALADICKVVFLECPVQRRYRGNEPKNGERIDYWAWYKKDIEVILEKKSTYLSINGKEKCPSNIKTSLKDLKKQLNSIKAKTIWESIVYNDCNTVYKIGLQMVYFYGKDKNEEKLTKDRYDLENISTNLLDKVGKKILPDWSAIWFNEEKPFLYEEDGRFYAYPGVLWLAYFEILKREK
jgi:hypothetical protein